MKDKIVVVTGSTSGIGFGIASKFAKNGGTLVINGLASDSEVKKLSSELKLLGAPEVLFDSADLSKPAEIDRMFKNIISSLLPCFWVPDAEDEAAAAAALFRSPRPDDLDLALWNPFCKVECQL